MKKIIFASLLLGIFVQSNIVNGQAFTGIEGVPHVTLKDLFNNPTPLWVSTPAVNTIQAGPNALRFQNTICNGTVQYTSKSIPAIPAPFSVVAPDNTWKLQFDMTVVQNAYANFGTAHVLMALSDNTFSPTNPPITTGISGSTVTTTNNDIIGIMLTSPANGGVNSQVGIFAKDFNSGNNNITTYTSNGTGTGTTVNTSTITNPNTSSMPGIVNGIAVPAPTAPNVRTIYRMTLSRMGDMVSLVVFNVTNSANPIQVGTMSIVLPSSAATSLTNFVASNMPQGGNRSLTSIISNLLFARQVSSVVVANLGSTTTASLYPTFCNSAFNCGAAPVTLTVTPSIPGTPIYLWTSPTSAYGPNFSSSTISLLSCSGAVTGGPANPNLQYYPYNLRITNFIGNTASEAYTFNQNNQIQINTACRMSNSENNNSNFILSPNPAQNNIKIVGLSNLGIIHTAEIFNMNGQSVQKENIESEKTEIELNVSALPQGIYILKVDTENGQQVQKFVKE